jgi:hypothetical protein
MNKDLKHMLRFHGVIFGIALICFACWRWPDKAGWVFIILLLTIMVGAALSLIWIATKPKDD